MVFTLVKTIRVVPPSEQQKCHMCLSLNAGVMKRKSRRM